ncbi:MAG: SGNH/GDSL hydrolase family protein [Thermoleophilia bacterium]
MKLSRRWIVAVGALVVVLAAALVAAGVVRSRQADAVAAVDDGPIYVPTDRAEKMELLEALEQPPQLLIFGGSRATRFEPSYIEKKTGLRGFNLAFQNGRPEDAWAFLNYLHESAPNVRPRIVWFAHVEAFREQGLSAGIVQDERLSRWFPEEMIAAAAAKLPHTAAEAPKGNDLRLTTFGPDGVVLHNRYDDLEAGGRTLDRALKWSINLALKRYATTTAALDPRSTKYFEKTLKLAQQLGTRPVIVLMPLHPRLLRAVRDAGWEERHAEVMAYLRRMEKRYGCIVLDFSDLRAVEGDPDAYYDGFHVKRSLARRILDVTMAEAPAAFK